MNDSLSPGGNAASAELPPGANKTSFWMRILLVLLLVFSVARVEAQDSDYITIIRLVDQAESLSGKGMTNQARAKYIEARAALLELQRNEPTWNPKMVSFRLKSVTGKIAALAEKPAVANSAASAETSSPRTAAASSAAIPRVKLLSAGAEPRQLLRLHPGVGDKQSLTMTIKMNMAMQAGGQGAPAMDIPTMVMDMDATVTDVAANGDISYETLLNDATVATNTRAMPQVVEAMQASLAGLKGWSGSGTLSDRGINRKTEMKIPSSADAQIRQTMDQMKEFIANAAAPLPEESVGPGARWEFSMKVKSQGMTIDQTAQYELVSIEAERVSLRVTLKQHAANQKIQNPSMPGLKVDLTKMTNDGKGTSTIDLTKLLPVTGTLDQHMEMDMGMNLGQQKQTMSMNMDMKISMESK